MASDDFAVGLSPDKRLARLEIVEQGNALAIIDLDAGQLSTVIQELGRVRAQMAEEIPLVLDPNPQFKDVTRGAIFNVNRPHVVSKEFFIAARHPGFGWIAFAMSAEHGEILSNLINRQVDGMRPIKVPKKGIIT